MLFLRIDDFPGTKPEEFNNHNLYNFKLFDEVMFKHGYGFYTLGCIPKYMTDEHLQFFKEFPRIKVAIHGVMHDERFKNEFQPFQTEEDIFLTLKAIKEKWESVLGYSIDSYIPPHNVIDIKTCKALKKVSLINVFGGPETEVEVVNFAKNLGLNFQVSKFPEEYGRTDELIVRGSIEHLIKECQTRDVWLTLHWTWEKTIGFEHLDKYFTELKLKYSLLNGGY